MKSPPKGIRIDEDELAWFNATFPWKGALSGFLNQCIREFRVQWGNRPGPADIVPHVVRKASSRGF